MSYADKVFINMCQDILTNGTDTKGELVRPHWADGKKAYTIKRFGICNRYDLRKEFPALTLRPTGLRSAMDEILWIWQKKSNNIHDLNSHIWDEWADENGSIGKAYGYQLGVQHQYKGITIEKLQHAFPAGTFLQTDEYGSVFAKTDKNNNITVIYAAKVQPALKQNGDTYPEIWAMDQVNKVIYDLRNTPYNRRVLTNIYTFEDLHEMALYPCAYSMTFNVTKDENSEKLVLNSILNQRSNDVLTANNWNVAQYAILTMMIAQVCDMIPGEFVHMIADAHIYDRHVDIIRDLIKREPFPAPKVTLNPDIKDFYEFKTSDLIIEDYQKHPQVKNIPVAI